MSEKIARMSELHRKGMCACSQVVLLNMRVEETETRLLRAIRYGQCSWRRKLAMDLAILQFMREAYFRYATRCLAQYNAIKAELQAAGVQF